MNSYDYVIFHKGCFDGFTSFVILNNTNTIRSNAIIFPDVPSAKLPPSQIDNKNVIIMDVAYKYEVLKTICERANSVTFIDHHVTIHDDVIKLKNDFRENDQSDKSKIKIIYDEKECGASLTWKYFNKKKQMPLFVRYIKDNDIGTWKLKHTHRFIAGLETKFGLTLTNSNLKKWNTLFNYDTIKQIIKRGKIYWEYINYLLDMNSKRYSLEAFPSEKIYEEYSTYFSKPGEYKVAVICGSGCPSSSLLGLKMMNTIDCDFVIMWSLNLDRKEYVLAFRSKETDVGKIAQMFGGGGHKLASACSIPISKYNIQDLFFPQSLPRHT
jgi:oligoribonuclease NrnB/cAMP/cGMP phosphodiesterase (DHH superfamily)